MIGRGAFWSKYRKYNFTFKPTLTDVVATYVEKDSEAVYDLAEKSDQ